jgi:hypothetical protein
MAMKRRDKTEEKLVKFREVRDQIETRIKEWVAVQS